MSRRTRGEAGDDEQFDPEPYRMIGSAHAVSSEVASVERVQHLREVVAEVTRGRIPVPEKRGPRF